VQCSGVSDDRSTKRAITADECQALAKAMQAPEVRGNLAAAARLLGIKPNRAYKIARSDVYIRAMQLGVDPATLVPTDAEALDRGSVVPPSELAETKALLRQERLLAKRDWQELGITEEQAAHLEKLEKFATLPLSHSILVTHGGMMSCYTRLLQLFDKYHGELEKGMLPTEETCVGGEMVQRDEGDVERAWVGRLIELSAEMRSVHGQLQKGRLMIIKAQQMAREMRRGERKGGGTAGPPILVQAQPGSTVNLNASDKEPDQGA
jgi:hypothetical protein